jgi:Bifunctional DNA primase/polymerase, N-terminal
MATVLEIRQALVDHGYVPIPVKGKIPSFKSWQNVDNVSPAMLDAWSKNWPGATNTGILTKFTPTLDADILNEPAAIAIEALVRERFEERGYILPRIGKPPKRAIPFRTVDPFAKITVNLIAANGSTGEKIEFMCDGQQIVAAGIHPDTGKPYIWPLGNPTDIAHDDLPDISEAEAQQLVHDIVELLCRDFGYARAVGRARKGNGAQPGDAAEDWQQLVDDIRAGHELHANTRDLAAKMVRSGMDGGAIVNFLSGLMNSSAAPRDERWQDRYDNLPRQVDSIQAKIEREQAAAAAVAATAPTPGAGSGTPPPPPPSSPAAGPAPSAAPGPIPSSPIEDTLQTFERWLILPNRTPVYAMLGTVAANLLPGDPVWLGLVAPPSSAKTELLNSISALPFVVSVSTLTLASLLSGTPRRQRATGATGGLLRQVSDPGLLCLKDFTSTLTMRPDNKAEVLSALREIYDGKWTRYIGTDGGKPLHWKGKLGLVFGCTGAIDTQHSVSDALGNRFLLSRMEPGKGQLRWAFRHVGSKTAAMRRELAESVNLLFAAPRPDPQELCEDEIVRFERATELVVRLRGAVERDRYRRELDAIYGAEGPARFGLSLERLLAGLDVLGVERKKAFNVVISVALDSTPPLRRNIYRFLCKPLDPLIPAPASAAADLEDQ